MAVLCIDAGATAIICVGYDGEGREAVVVQEPARPTRPAAGWLEQDMGALWAGVARVVHTVSNALDEPVDLLAVCGPSDGCWLVDAAGEPTGPAILGGDRRAHDIVDHWQRSGVAEVVWQINGALPAAGMPNAILSWLQQHDPSRIERSTTALTCGGWIFHQLTGQRWIDVAGASVPFASTATGAHSAELLELYGMPWAERLLPPLMPHGQPLAPLGAAAAALVGLPAGTQVVLAPPDIVCTAIGSGAVLPGQASAALGAALCTTVVTAGRQHDRAAGGGTMALGIPGRSLRTFATAAGEEVIHWANAVLGLHGQRAEGVERLLDLASTSRPGASGLVFLPHLSPTGERAPFVDPSARGALLGLSLAHRRADVAQSMLEGMAFLVRECLAAAGARPRELRVSGRGASNAGWNQLIADVTGVPVVRSADAHVAARGAFVIALVAAGRSPATNEAIAQHVRQQMMFAPDTSTREMYADMAADVAAMRTALGMHGQRLAAMQRRALSTHR